MFYYKKLNFSLSKTKSVIFILEVRLLYLLVYENTKTYNFIRTWRPAIKVSVQCLKYNNPSNYMCYISRCYVDVKRAHKIDFIWCKDLSAIK